QALKLYPGNQVNAGNIISIELLPFTNRDLRWQLPGERQIDPVRQCAKRRNKNILPGHEIVEVLFQVAGLGGVDVGVRRLELKAALRVAVALHQFAAVEERVLIV